MEKSNIYVFVQLVFLNVVKVASGLASAPFIPTRRIPTQI